MLQTYILVRKIIQNIGKLSKYGNPNIIIDYYYTALQKNFFFVSKMLELILANLEVLISKIILILPG